MGNDGGTKIKRSDLVKTVSHKISEAQLLKSQESAKLKFQTCKLSGHQLGSSVVSDYKGNLYNKERVIEFILESKNKKPDPNFAHLKSLNDLVEIKNYLKCPITGAVVGSDSSIKQGTKFFYFAECGCAIFSQEIVDTKLVDLHKDEYDVYDYKNKDLEKVRTDLKNKVISPNWANCVQCGTHVSPYNVIYINSEDKAVTCAQEQRMEYLRKISLYHNLKKSKKVKKRTHKDPDSGDSAHKNKKITR